MTKEDAMDYLARCADESDPEYATAVALAVSALRAQVEAEREAPLTLDELREMDGEPVWVKPLAVWGIVDIEFATVFTREGDLNLNIYGGTGRLYRHKPPETVTT